MTAAAAARPRSAATSAAATLLSVALLLLLGGTSVCWAQLLDGGAAAAPAAVVVLATPTDLSACGVSTVAHMTARHRSCAKTMLEYEDPDAECCEGWAVYFGPNSTRVPSSANCFCDKSVWERMVKGGEIAYIDMATTFLVCARLGYVVPFYQEDDDGVGTGYCFGSPPDQELIDGAHIRHDHANSGPSTQDYVRRLSRDNLVMASFVTAPIAGVGILLLLWPLAWETVAHARDAVRLWQTRA